MLGIETVVACDYWIPRTTTPQHKFHEENMNTFFLSSTDIQSYPHGEWFGNVLESSSV